MATTAIVKANLFFSSKQSQNLHVKLCCVKSLKYSPRTKFAGVKVRRSIMVNCTTTSISTRNNDMADMINTNSKELEKYPFEKFSFDAIITTLKWLKITAVVTASSLLLWMMMYGRESALALSGGPMGGHSISLSSSSDSRSWYSSFSGEVPVVKETTVDIIVKILGTLTGLLVVAAAVAIVHGITRDPIGIFSIQVGLLVNGKSLQRDLDEIAKISDISNPSSWNLILKDTIKSLYRHRDDWKYAFSYVMSAYRCLAMKCFEELTLEERNTFDEVTLVNLNNIKTSITTQEEEADRSINTYIVVTIFVAIDAKHQEKLLDTMSSRAEVDRVFKELQLHDSANIKGVHVLWGPQRTNEVMSLEELKKRYPLLTRLKK